MVFSWQVYLGLHLDDGIDKLIQENVGYGKKQMKNVGKSNKLNDTLILSDR